MTLAPLFETIVLGVDGRQGGRDAPRLGQRLADAAGDELVAVRVLPYQYRPALRGARAAHEPIELDSVWRSTLKIGAGLRTSSAATAHRESIGTRQPGGAAARR
jgi:hypothetical protein